VARDSPYNVTDKVEYVVSRVDTKNKVSILIVDDEPSVGDALKLVLEAKGYEVVLVNNGRDGIEQSRSRPFQFAILDLFLTDAYGLQLMKDIQQHQPEIQTLLITGHGSPEIFAEARRLGAIGALSKPFQPAEILTLITNALQE
jgi:DNA-binding NtrC family response regulator